MIQPESESLCGFLWRWFARNGWGTVWHFHFYTTLPTPYFISVGWSLTSPRSPFFPMTPTEPSFLPQYEWKITFCTLFLSWMSQMEIYFRKKKIRSWNWMDYQVFFVILLKLKIHEYLTTTLWLFSPAYSWCISDVISWNVAGLKNPFLVIYFSSYVLVFILLVVRCSHCKHVRLWTLFI